MSGLGRVRMRLQQDLRQLSRRARMAYGGVLLLAVGLLVLLSAGNDPLDASSSLLSVEEYGPAGQLDDRADANVIHLTFNMAMVPEELPADTVAGPLRLTPAVPGRFWWTGTHTLVFAPDEPLPLATKFTVTLPAGSVTAVDGTAFYQDFTFDFTTPRLQVEDVSTRSPGTDIGRDEQIMVRFSQPVDCAQVRRYLTVQANGSELRGYRCRHPRANELNRSAGDEESDDGYEYASADAGRVPLDRIVIIDPETPWPAGAELSATMQAGLTGREGDCGLESEYRWTGTVTPPLTFIGIGTSGDNHPCANHPYDGITLRFSAQIRPDEVARALRFTPAVQLPDWVYNERRPAQVVTIPVPFKPGTDYRVTLNRSLRSTHRQPLTNTVDVKLHICDLEPRISMMSGQVTMRPDQLARLKVTVVNHAQLTLRLAKVTPEQFLGIKPFAWQVNRSWPVAVPRNTPTNRQLPLAEVLPAGSNGFVRVEVQEPRQPSESQDPTPRSLMVQVTPLGVTGKFSPETTLIWVTALQGGTGVADAEVVIYEPKKGELWRGRTGADGLVTAPGWNRWSLATDNAWYTPELLVVVRKGEDQAVLSSRWDNGLEAWRFPVSHVEGGDGSELRGLVFSDRGLYRPGETVKLKGIARATTGNGMALPAARELEYIIRDAQGEKAGGGSVTVSERGSFDLTHALPANAMLGDYVISVRQPPPRREDRDNWYYGDVISGSFRVAEFRAASIKATVDLPAERQYFGGGVTALLTGRALAGAALANRAVHYSASMTINPPCPAGWDQYSFSPLCLDDRTAANGEADALLADGDGILDAQGQRRLTVTPPASGYGQPRGAAANMTDGELTVEATVRDLGEQRTAGRAAIPILRSALMVGLRVPDAFAGAGSTVRVDAVVLDRDGRKVAGRAISWQVIRRTWENRQRQTEGGTVWESRAKDAVVATGTAQSAAQPVSFSVTPGEGGYYIVAATVQDERGRAIKAAQGFYLWGEGGDWWHGNADRVDIVTDRALYKPGDTARLILRSPFASCRALVTVEREKMMSQQMMELTGTSPMIEVGLTEGQVPNVYVGVMII
ncbi:MAG TPA: MG2 domain-containing protein, partial [bacterium]|nr:MG2 domain-containing protein [bacterium]